MQRRRALYSAPAHAAEKSPILCSCTCSGVEGFSPLLHMQRSRGLFSAPAHSCTCSGEEPSTPLLHAQQRRTLYSAQVVEKGLHSAAGHEAERSTLLCCCTWSGVEHSAPLLHMKWRTVPSMLLHMQVKGSLSSVSRIPFSAACAAVE